MISLNLDYHLSYHLYSIVTERKLIYSIHAEWISDSNLPENLPILWNDIRMGRDNIILEMHSNIIMLNKNGRDIDVTVYSSSAKSAQSTIDYLQSIFVPSDRQPNLLDVTFWYDAPRGTNTYNRQLDAPSWKDIMDNYPEKTRNHLDRLMKLEPINTAGKLILWQGDPGVGKTYALRALAEEWASWCTMHYILDPENFLSQGAYLVSVILGNEGYSDPQRIDVLDKPSWRLIVLEDTGELLSKDAKDRVGQGLSRLLNLCEGLLGQGLRVMVLITTNEEVDSLHQAVVRPGRCLSNIVFDRFSMKDAQTWLSNKIAPGSVIPSTPGKHITLADMYALIEGQPIPKHQNVGFIS